MAKAKKDQDKDERAVTRALGDDEHAHPDIDHSHAPYQSQADADIRLQRATGDSRTATPQE